MKLTDLSQMKLVMEWSGKRIPSVHRLCQVDGRLGNGTLQSGRFLLTCNLYLKQNVPSEDFVRYPLWNWPSCSNVILELRRRKGGRRWDESDVVLFGLGMRREFWMQEPICSAVIKLDEVMWGIGWIQWNIHDSARPSIVVG
jgi:hypothetical protein